MSPTPLADLQSRTALDGRTAADTLLAIPSRAFSDVKFALVDGADAPAGLQQLCQSLNDLKEAALDEQLELMHDESVGWIDDILKAAKALVGAPSSDADAHAALFRAVGAAMELAPEARAAAFAKGAPLEPNRLYRRFVQVEKDALARGMSPEAKSELKALWATLGGVSADGDILVNVKGHVEGLVDFLTDEGLLGD